MKSRIIPVDLAKDVFEVAAANDQSRIRERRRLLHEEFRTFLATQPSALLVVESRGTTHY